MDEVVKSRQVHALRGGSLSFFIQYFSFSILHSVFCTQYFAFPHRAKLCQVHPHKALNLIRFAAIQDSATLCENGMLRTELKVRVRSQTTREPQAHVQVREITLLDILF